MTDDFLDIIQNIEKTGNAEGKEKSNCAFDYIVDEVRKTGRVREETVKKIVEYTEKNN